MSEKVIPITQEVYEQLNDVATKRNITPSKLANQLLESEINRKFNKFFNGRKWAIPKNTFIVSALPKEQWSKLRKWRDKDDLVTIDTMKDGEILILNQTRLDKRSPKVK